MKPRAGAGRQMGSRKAEGAASHARFTGTEGSRGTDYLPYSEKSSRRAATDAVRNCCSPGAYGPGRSESSQASYQLRLFRSHGLIEPVGERRRYQLTPAGRPIVAFLVQLYRHLLAPVVQALPMESISSAPPSSTIPSPTPSTRCSSPWGSRSRFPLHERT